VSAISHDMLDVWAARVENAATTSPKNDTEALDVVEELLDVAKEMRERAHEMAREEARKL
jgi:hypothetical protein